MASTAVSAAKPPIRVAALSGSLRKGSFNLGLLRAGKIFFLAPFPFFSPVWLAGNFFLFFFCSLNNNNNLNFLTRSDRAQQGVTRRNRGRARRHIVIAAAQHRPRSSGDLPAGGRSLPYQNPRRRRNPLRLAGVQLLCHRSVSTCVCLRWYIWFFRV